MSWLVTLTVAGDEPDRAGRDALEHAITAFQTALTAGGLEVVEGAASCTEAKEELRPFLSSAGFQVGGWKVVLIETVTKTA
jgi:hypothetical protein